MGCQRPGKSLPIVACGGGDDAHQDIAIRVLNITGVSNPGHTELNASVNLVVYVSTADRIFVRQINSTRSGSGSLERSPDAHSGGAASFAGHTLTLIGG